MAYKSFTNGFPLPASDLNNFLMDQSVITFASSTERDSTLTAPKEGMLTYLQDTNTYTYYDGTAWQNLIGGGDPIDQSLLTTTGDMIYASAAETAARLGIGSEGDVLTVASGIPSWAAPAGGGVGTDWELISGTNIANGSSSFTITGISGYAKYLVDFYLAVSLPAIYTLNVNGSPKTSHRLETVGNGSSAQMILSSNIAQTSVNSRQVRGSLYFEFNSTGDQALYRFVTGAVGTSSTDKNYAGEFVFDKPTTSLGVSMSAGTTGGTGPSYYYIYGGN